MPKYCYTSLSTCCPYCIFLQCCFCILGAQRYKARRHSSRKHSPVAFLHLWFSSAPQRLGKCRSLRYCSFSLGLQGSAKCVKEHSKTLISSVVYFTGYKEVSTVTKKSFSPGAVLTVQKCCLRALSCWGSFCFLFKLSHPGYSFSKTFTWSCLPWHCCKKMHKAWTQTDAGHVSF